MDWLTRMNNVLEYIENNLDGEISENKIAELSASPKGMFPRIFATVMDMSLSNPCYKNVTMLSLRGYM